MKTTYSEIIDNYTKYRVCKCGKINHYENDKCHDCGGIFMIYPDLLRVTNKRVVVAAVAKDMELMELMKDDMIEVGGNTVLSKCMKIFDSCFSR